MESKLEDNESTTGKLVYGMGLNHWAQEYNDQNYGFDRGAIAYPCAPGIQGGLSQIGASWTNDDMAKIFSMYNSAAPYFKVYNAVKYANSLNGFAGHGLLFPTSVAVVANNWKNWLGFNVTQKYVELMSSRDALRFPHLPLIYRLIHGGSMYHPEKDNPLSYQSLISASPKCLRYKTADNQVSEGQMEWGCQDRISEAFKRWEGENGDFPGVDYNALFGLYALNEPSWAKVLNNPYYEENFAVSFPYLVGNRYQGTTQLPVDVKTLEYLSSISKISSTGGANFRNAKVIDLLPGFEANLGCNFTAFIKDYSCGDCTHREIGGDFITAIAPQEEDEFVMDTLYYNPLEAYNIPEADEEQYSPSADEIVADSIHAMEDIYDANDADAIAYLDYLNSLTEGGQNRMPTSASTKILVNSSIEVYPNPSEGIFNIQTNEENYVVIIFDAVGKLIYRNDNVSGNFRVNLEGRPKGLYLLNVLSNSGFGRESFKLVLY